MHLNSERLGLRPVKSTDLAELFRIYGDPATNTFNPAGPYPDRHHAKNVLTRWELHWTEHGFGNWAISEKNDPETIIGFGGLSISDYATVSIYNLGYRFETQAWGKGYATELSCFALRHGFTKLKLPEISAIVRPQHLASQRVLEKSGLRFVSELLDVENERPSLLYSLTREEWLKNGAGS